MFWSWERHTFRMGTGMCVYKNKNIHTCLYACTYIELHEAFDGMVRRRSSRTTPTRASPRASRAHTHIFQYMNITLCVCECCYYVVVEAFWYLLLCTQSLTIRCQAQNTRDTRWHARVWDDGTHAYMNKSTPCVFQGVWSQACLV
jgi:hypothetical protein